MGYAVTGTLSADAPLVPGTARDPFPEGMCGTQGAGHRFLSVTDKFSANRKIPDSRWNMEGKLPALPAVHSRAL